MMTACVAEPGLELVRSGELSIPDTHIRVVLRDVFAELDQV
jgi:hypothetical protein